MGSTRMNLTNNLVWRCFVLFPKKDRTRIFLVSLVQIFLSVLDLIGVFIIGLLGSLTITGITSRTTGNRVTAFLELVGIAEESLKYQVAALGLIGSLVLTIKTFASLYLSRKTLFFLSYRAAYLSSTLLRNLLSRNLLVVQSQSIQQTLFALTQGVTTVTVGIVGAVVYLVADISLLIVLLVGLFIADTLIAFSTLTLFSIVALVLYFIMRHRVRNFGGKQAEYSIESAQRMAEVIHSYRELFVKNRREFYADKIGNLRMKLAKSTAELAFMQNISKYALELTIVIGGLCIAAIQFSTQTTSRAVAVLAIFIVASTRIAPAVLRVQQSLLQIKGSIAIATPTLDLIGRLGHPTNLSKFNEIPFSLDHEGFVPEIQLKSVNFAYPDSGANVLANISLEIKPGTVVAIVGSSGAGKTTLVDVILGILDPDLGDVKISQLAPAECISKWPGSIGYVPQDVSIIDGTILENVCMGFDPRTVPSNAIEQALETAHLRDYVNSLPSGVDHEVGDRGTKLSGGQRQRLGIARALITKPRLIVLDEATSSLDGETESSVSNAIQALKGNVTVVMIAHRLSTVRQADVVLYLENGTIAAQGSFEQVRMQSPNFDKQAKLIEN